MITDVALTGLTKSMDALTTQLRAAMDFADKAQRASLALGQTYDDTRTQLGGTMEGLRGDINQRFGAAMAGAGAGIGLAATIGIKLTIENNSNCISRATLLPCCFLIIKKQDCYDYIKDCMKQMQSLFYF